MSLHLTAAELQREIASASWSDLFQSIGLAFVVVLGLGLLFGAVLVLLAVIAPKPSRPVPPAMPKPRQAVNSNRKAARR